MRQQERPRGCSLKPPQPVRSLRRRRGMAPQLQLQAPPDMLPPGRPLPWRGADRRPPVSRRANAKAGRSGGAGARRVALFDRGAQPLRERFDRGGVGAVEAEDRVDYDVTIFEAKVATL